MLTKQLIFASHNKGKVKEMQTILRPLDVGVLSAEEADLPDVEENGNTFEENALLKAKAAAEASGVPAFADDSGLCIHALKDAPGIHTARYAQKCGGYEEAFQCLLKELENKEDKSAHFQCVIALAYPNGTTQTFNGRIEGFIVPPKGENGFGFDPIFQPAGYQETFAELPEDIKNKISHRGLAMAAFLKYIKEAIQK